MQNARGPERSTPEPFGSGVLENERFAEYSLRSAIEPSVSGLADFLLPFDSHVVKAIAFVTRRI